MSLEKDGVILLTNEDLEEYRKGVVSARIELCWNLSFESLQEIIQNNNYRIIDNERFGPITSTSRKTPEGS